MDALRAFIVSGVESATSLLLQDRFGWNDGSIGFCIGLTFCLTVPAYLLHRQYHGRFQDISLLRVYTIVGMLAAILLGIDLSKKAAASHQPQSTSNVVSGCSYCQ